MKIYIVFISIILIFTTPSAVQKNSYSYYIEITQLSDDCDFEFLRYWKVDENSIRYLSETKTDTIVNIQNSNSAQIVQLLDSLKYYKDYGCPDTESIHSNSYYRIYANWEYKNKKEYANFTVMNCYLNKNLDSLIHLINLEINKFKGPEIPKIQEGFGQCKCIPYKKMRVFEK